MEANKHYLDGELVPMPCPAEYNFYFTHDVLVTDLAAVYFDIDRVKEDLDYIARHANEENIIPHAYYWKDGKYVTEYASSDNWNNFWLILVTGSYLRHSGDIEFVSQLYPYVSKSLERALLTKEDDDLMWSYRPDWWDIGHNYGPRSYMTILAIKAIREYVFISLRLDQNLAQLAELATMADDMQTALTERLWDNEMNYLVNYHEDGSLDRHYYIGSLLAAHYDLLDEDKRSALVNSAATAMVDPQVGIYNAFPMDFEKWGEFMRFRGNEAGAKYYYFNGGIWPQGNAWYALALIGVGFYRSDDVIPWDSKRSERSAGVLRSKKCKQGQSFGVREGR
jgi:glycogen debranching enzyme